MADNQTKQKMIKAKQLIQDKQYAQARRILESVDHPTATKWLSQLDDIELGDPFANMAPQKLPPQPVPSSEPPDDLPDFQYLLQRDIISLILFPISLIWIVYDVRRAQKAIKRYGAENVPGAQAMIKFNRFLYLMIVFLPMLCLLISILTRP